MGGGGFSMEPENLALDRYLLDLVDRPQPRVCFMPTASGDADSYIVRFYTSFTTLPCQPTHLSLFDTGNRPDHRSVLLSQDIIYVGGGNTRSMLAVWREWEIDAILREAWQQGIVLAGISAGSLCWFAEGVTDSVPGRLTPMRGLGLLPGSNCPHFDGEAERRPAYHHLVADGSITAGYAADDGAALHFVGDRLLQVVTSRPEAKAYRVDRHGESAVETPLPVTYLGQHSPTKAISGDA